MSNGYISSSGVVSEPVWAKVPKTATA